MEGKEKRKTENDVTGPDNEQVEGDKLKERAGQSDESRELVKEEGVVAHSGKFGASCPEGRRFESHSSCHVGTLGKSFAHSYCCLLELWEHSWLR